MKSSREGLKDWETLVDDDEVVVLCPFLTDFSFFFFFPHFLS